jgi:hypothetical protein
MLILLVAIDGYFINDYSISDYCLFFYWWLLMVILLMTITCFSIGGY